MNRLLIGICILFAASRAGAATADNYAYAWPLQTEGDSAAWQVELTPEIYAAVRSENLRDIEVVNASGAAVPMAPRSMVSTTSAQANDVELPLFVLPGADAGAAHEDSLRLHIERDANGRLRRLDTEVAAAPTTAAGNGDLILDASAVQTPIDSLWLSWDEAADAVTAQFSVSGSDDLQQWRTLVGNASVLAMHQNGNALSRRQIALNGARATYLRLHRLDNQAALKNLRIRARTLTRSTLVQPASIWVDAAAVPAPAAQAPASMAATFYYRLPAPLVVETLKLQLADDNSLARVRVASRRLAADSAPAPWTIHADFTAFRLRQDDTVVGNDEVAALALGRAQDWRIEATTPLGRAPTLRVAFRPDRFTFLAEGGGPYRLVAGSSSARRGDYPIDAALAQLRGKLGNEWQPPLAALGARITLQGDAAYAPAPVRRDWKTWLLWAVLVGAAALIGGLALSLLRKPKPES